jgi:hypothetical protein
VTDPVSGQTETVEASAEAPVTVKPAASPLLAVSSTGPATLEAGASGSLAIEITTSNPSNTSATFCVYGRGDRPVAPTPLDLSGFQVAGNTMTGSHGFTAPAAPGLYSLAVDAHRDVETASFDLPLTVTPDLLT